MNRTNLILLFANWYSGATLTTIFLNSHPRIISNGEAFPFTSDDKTDYICSCGQPLLKCDFYTLAASHMRQSAKEWNRHSFSQLPSITKSQFLNRLLISPRLTGAAQNAILNSVPRFKNSIRSFLDAHYKFIANAIELSGASVYLDGTKSITRAALLANDARYSIKAIHLIRDGRGFCASFMRNKRLDSNTEGITQSTKRWVDYIQSVNRFQINFPQIPLITVRYEDICRSNQATLGTLFRFIGVGSCDVSRPQFSDRHILGNVIKDTFSGEIKDDQAWRLEISESVQAQITSRISRELGAFDYLIQDPIQ